MKLYRFSYSPYARKVQTLLELLGRPYVAVDVPYSDRNELARSRAVTSTCRSSWMTTARWCAIRPGSVPAPAGGPGRRGDDPGVAGRPDVGLPRLVRQHAGGRDVPHRLAGDTRSLEQPGDRALYVLIKERKFGAGCVDRWLQERDELVARANALLEPTRRTLAAQPFVFGARPTLADAALYGEFAMLEAADPGLLERFPGELRDWMARVDAAAAERRAR